MKENRVPSDWQKYDSSDLEKQRLPTVQIIALFVAISQFEDHIIDRRIRGIVTVSTNQSSFVSKCDSTDTIHVAGLLVERHREEQKPVNLSFLKRLG